MWNPVLLIMIVVYGPAALGFGILCRSRWLTAIGAVIVSFGIFMFLLDIHKVVMQ